MRSQQQMILLVEKDAHETRNNLLNILQNERPLKVLGNKFPMTSVIVYVADKLLFFEEFMSGLINQTFPKEKIVLNFINESKCILIQITLSLFTKKGYELNFNQDFSSFHIAFRFTYSNQSVKVQISKQH